MLNLNNPNSFSEKIQWIKVFGQLEKYSKYVDKYDVREYVKNTAGKQYLIPLVGMWNNFENIPFEKLPKKFVLKATHGSGYNYICKDKSLIDIKQLKKLASKWLKENYYKKGREEQYKLCWPKIICEGYLEDDSGSLRDYKIFCFNGIPQIIQIDSDRFSVHKRDLMNIDWERLPVTLGGHSNLNKIILKPKKLPEMIEIAKKLSKKIPFVRVDLYLINNKIYFGELTFTPGNGLEKFFPNEADYQFGELIDLSKYHNN